jgi:hypothetical protein
MGNLFKFPGYVTFIAGGIWGFFLSLEIVQDWLGDILGFILGVLVFPILITIAPLVEGLSNSNWMPFLVVYGSMAIGTVLVVIGGMIDGD